MNQKKNVEIKKETIENLRLKLVEESNKRFGKEFTEY